MAEKAREFHLYAPSLTVDLMYLTADERGVYISLCSRMLTDNSPVPVSDTDDAWLCKRMFGCTRGKFKRILEHLIRLNLMRIEDGKIINSTCMEMVAASRARLARRNVPRNEIFERDGYCCTYCGTTDGPFHCDHVIPVSRGGMSDLSNLTTACSSCNIKKGAMTADEFLSVASGFDLGK